MNPMMPFVFLLGFIVGFAVAGLVVFLISVHYAQEYNID